MKKSTRMAAAKETLSIIDNGYYYSSQLKIDIKHQLEQSRIGSRLYKPGDFNTNVDAARGKTGALAYDTTISVENTTVLKAAASLAGKYTNVGCLNFASARNPGGGFLNGAQAQEESLAVSSSLYAIQMQHFELYEYNRSRHTYLYSDYMIYGKDVVVFRDDSGALLEAPYTLSILTSPAVNIGAIRTNKPEEMEHVRETMLQRTDKVLSVFLENGIEHLLLGAWGCGVFQNEPVDIAACFARLLKGTGKYARCFKTIFFAVYDRSKDEENYHAFKTQFEAP